MSIGKRLLASAVTGGLLVASTSVITPTYAADFASAIAPADDETNLRIGVIALTGAISAVGQTAELSTPLPFTTTSAADVLGLDASLAGSLQQALQGTDLEVAIAKVEGVTLVDDGDASSIAFTYDRTVTTALPLVHDDGDLRFGSSGGAGDVTVSLTTRPNAPFVVAVDPAQPDPLLRVALVNQPVLDLAIDIETPDLTSFPARQGFTAVNVTGGTYRVHREQKITMRDPDGRGLLTLEDLRYSTLPDLFRIETRSDTLDVGLNVRLPGSLAGGAPAERSGTLVLTATPDGAVWPTAADATRTYGDALAQATGLSMTDGLTSLAQYTGTVLALQDAADVPFPNLRGGTADLFAPGDRLLALLSTSAAAQVTCGVSPENPPTGAAAPGDTVYCQATTAQALVSPTGISWVIKDGGTIVGPRPDAALGDAPSALIEISGSDGEPDLEVTFTTAGQELTARSMPHTVQDVVGRIGELSGSTASATLIDDRLDIAVDIVQNSGGSDLELGNPSALGALVGLTGLSSADPKKLATARAEADDSRFDVGFGIQTGPVPAGESRQTVLLPRDKSLLSIDRLSAEMPDPATLVENLPARVGFLAVLADVTALSLGAETTTGPAVELERVTAPDESATDALPISALLTPEGALQPDLLKLTSQMTASIAFTATEKPLANGVFATGTAGGATGDVSVLWKSSGLPTVSSSPGYEPLRVFDPVPAAFISGTARVTKGAGAVADTVTIDVDAPTNLYRALNLAPSPQPVEVTRHLVGDGVACQSTTVLDAATLTCEELAPNGETPYVDGDPVQVIVLGDPFALRDSVIEGLSTTLTEFDRLTGDNVTESPAPLAFDQYASTLPLVDLTPAQLAVEREALREGLAAISTAATADERGSSLTPVSSAQELATAVPQLVKLGGTGGYRPALAFTLGANDLGVDLVASSPTGAELEAPLRLDDVGTAVTPGRGQVASGSTAAGAATLNVGVASTTTLAILVDRDTARPAVADRTGTTSTATIDLAGADLDGHPLQAGIAELTVAQAGSSADLGVEVVTAFVTRAGGKGLLETRRANARTPGRAAEAKLTVGTGDVMTYAADATDSSGGEGAVQPAPDRMQVRFLAEGLDGLSTALGSAMDGAAVRNLDPASGAPISAPLIGTDLDAGAGVPDTLTALTSQLRTELRKSPVSGATTAADLTAALDDAVAAAINRTTGVRDVTAADIGVEVRCANPAAACVPCPVLPPPAPGAPVPPPCTTDGPTVWKTVTITAGLTGAPKTGNVAFETGLAGLEVRSDNEVATETSWTLPIALRLTRGVGPQVIIEPTDALKLEVNAAMPAGGIDAIVGYLPARLSPTGLDGTVDTTIKIKPAADTYDLFDLYAGDLEATPSFTDTTGKASETGLSFDFNTLARDSGVFGLSGNIDIPWSAANGFTDDVTYNDVKLDVGDVIKTIATPFQVVDPYLAPVRDVVDVLRTPIPVVSDLSELAGGDEVSLLSLLGTLSDATEKPQLELAYRVIGLVGGVTDMVSALAPLAAGNVPLEDLAAAGALLSLDPTEVSLYEKCSQTIKTTVEKSQTNGTSSSTSSKKSQPCDTADALADGKDDKGANGQTTADKRKGTRTTKKELGKTTTNITGSLPGFSLPFLADPDQLMDVLTAEGEAAYFRLDLGTLAAQVSYTQKFGPIMAGPVPIVPFVGGSISIEGRLAMGFDSYPQTLAAESVAPGDVSALLDLYDGFDAGDVIREGFYIDDLDADGVDVPEVKLVTTLEAGAGVSIGIVTAGLKGGITLTINLDLNDPDDDGRLRTSEIRTIFSGDAECIFDVSADLEAFIAIFIEIDLLLTSLEYQFDLLRLGPYELFSYGCPDLVPTLVQREGDTLALTSGARSAARLPGSGAINDRDLADDFEVRQFDKAGGLTLYEISGFGRVQNVEIEELSGIDAGKWRVTIYESGITTSTKKLPAFITTSRPTFQADGGALKDKISFLPGEDLADDGSGGFTLTTTPFDTDVSSLTGGDEDDILVSGDGDDRVFGGRGNDSIDAGLGDDVARGDDGNDVVGGGAGNDDLFGGLGDDRLEGGPGSDRAYGGAGNDSLVGGPGRDVRALLVRPRGSKPNVVAEQIRVGFDSGDILVGGGDSDTVDGGDGSDVVVGGEAATLTGGTLASHLGTSERTVDVLVEGATTGAQVQFVEETVTVDTVIVPTDSELDGLCRSGTPAAGPPTTDFVTGGTEQDVVIGGDGPDTLDGGPGPDDICGLAGDDALSGDGGGDEDDTETVDRNINRDINRAIDRSVTRDIIRGGTGNDRVQAGPGDDVVFGDDVDLWRNGALVADGSLGAGSAGVGDDYLDGGTGDDVLAGGDGSDLLLGDLGNDSAFGEGRDTAERGGAAPPLSERLVACNTTTRVVGGLVDLNGDLIAGPATSGIVADTGRLAGLAVVDGAITAPGSGGARFQGLLGGQTVVIDGSVDLDRDGGIDADDTGMIPLASMLDTGANTDGDCLLTGPGNDELRGGSGSDYLGAGDGTDLLVGGDGNDLALGDGGTDVLLGGAHHDVLVGGDGDDHLLGGDGDDRLRGNEGADDLVGGSDVAAATDGQDVLLGGREDDVLVAENGIIVSESIVEAVTRSTVPWSSSALAPAAVTATTGSPLVFAGSALVCGPDPATRFLTMLADDGLAGTPELSPGTPLAYDELYGGYDCDFAIGSPGDDLVRGGQDDDVVEGGSGADIVYGDEGDDVVLGGSSFDATRDARFTRDRDGAGVPDRGDEIRGDGGPDGLDGADLIAGDNALPIRVEELASRVGYDGPAYVLRLHDVATTTSTPLSRALGNDVISGDGETDRIFGQGGDDRIDGGIGDDYLEGNDGGDELRGGDGDDDVLGGSSTSDGLPLGSTGTRLFTALSVPVDLASSGLLDGGQDVVAAGPGDDVVLGDNGRITRPAVGGVLRSTRTDGTTLRSVVLHDVATTATRAPLDVGAGDLIAGDDGRDLLFGQVGDDTVSGGADDDYLEGNVGDDRLDGGDGQDDLVGGGSSATGAIITVSGAVVDDRLLTPVTEATDESAAGLLDGNDDLAGGDDRDVLLGDNGRITRDGPNRPLLGGANGLYLVRQVAMADEGPGVWAGSDRLSGGAGDDDLYGQFDNTRTRRPKQAFEGQRVQGDILDGGDGDDALIGDQGVDVPTPAGSLGAVDRSVSDRRGFLDEQVRPFGTLVRVVTLSQSTRGGDDLVLGGDGDDSIHTGAGKDVVNADSGDDVVFAGDGGDAIWGGTGHDLLFGGRGPDLLDIKRRTQDPLLWQRAAPVQDTDRRRRTVNGRDVLHGGAGPDAMQADQGDRGSSRRLQGDRLVDWRHTINYYKTCRSGYGRGKVWNKRSRSMISTLRQLAVAHGSVGSAELALPRKERVTTYPDRGSFVCEPS